MSVSPDLVSRMTDRVHVENREWRSRPLTASEALEKKGIAEMKKIVPEALLVVLLLAAWGGFEFTTGYGAQTERLEVLISAIVAGAAAGMVEGFCRSCIDYRLHDWWTDVSSEPLERAVATQPWTVVIAQVWLQLSMGWDPSGGAIRSLAKQDGQVEGFCRSCIDYRLHDWWTDVSSEPLVGNSVSSGICLLLVWGPYVGDGHHRRAWRADRSRWVSLGACGRHATLDSSHRASLVRTRAPPRWTAASYAAVES